MKKSAVISAAVLIPMLVIAADRLNVKTGLWEIVAATDTQGAPAIAEEALANLTPEERAKMESVMKSREAGGPTQHTSKECITEKDLEKPFGSETDESCKTTLVKTTDTMQEANIVCTGERPGKGKLRINTPTPETMNGMIEIKVGAGTEAMTVKTHLTGKWLGASCEGAED